MLNMYSLTCGHLVLLILGTLFLYVCTTKHEYRYVDFQKI